MWGFPPPVCFFFSFVGFCFFSLFPPPLQTPKHPRNVLFPLCVICASPAFSRDPHFPPPSRPGSRRLPPEPEKQPPPKIHLLQLLNRRNATQNVWVMCEFVFLGKCLAAMALPAIIPRPKHVAKWKKRRGKGRIRSPLFLEDSKHRPPAPKK